MVRSGKKEKNGDRKGGEAKGKFEDDLDALFKLPLAEFTAARNTLAKSLKQGGRSNESDFVKTLVKPSISAWTVNQLYWSRREAFDRLIATGERFRQAQSSRHARKVADMREALQARGETLSQLSDLATELLRDAGHNPTQDTIRRITTTLEAMSAYASLPDAPRPGRLAHDVDPPGFESLASFTPSSGMPELAVERERVTLQKRAATSTEPAAGARQLEEKRQTNIAAAKVSLQEAKSLLMEARSRLQSLETAQKKASSEAKAAEKQRREAEERFQKARAAAEDATRRARGLATELQEAANAAQEAKRTVEKATKELELLFRESPRK